MRPAAAVHAPRYHRLADSSRLVQTELARIGIHATSLRIPTMPQTLHYVILYSENFHRDDQKAAKKAGIETLVIAYFH